MSLDFGTAVKTYWPIVVMAAAIVGAAYVADYRIRAIEEKQSEVKGEPLKLALLEQSVKRLRCDVRNVKRLLKNQDEVDCEDAR